MTHEEQETSSIATGGRDSDEMMTRDGGCEGAQENMSSSRADRGKQMQDEAGERGGSEGRGLDEVGGEGNLS